MPSADAQPRFLVVELEQDLHHSRRTGIFHNVALLPGVKCVFEFNDLTGLTTEQLMAMTQPKRRVDAPVTRHAARLPT